MSIEAKIGDIFKSQMKTLVNTVNCVGIMGKGIAAVFKKEYPQMFREYKERCDLGQMKLGEPYLYSDLTGISVINFPTKEHWRSSSRVIDIEKGLDYFIAHSRDWGMESVAFPPLGCGNGGLEWEEIGPLMYQKLGRLEIPVEIYAPYGTPAVQLKTDFLSTVSQMSLEGKGQKLAALNKGWIPLLEVLRNLQSQSYAPRVGRVIFQKICYVITEMGVPTGFRFERGSYGPFAEDVQAARHAFANRNWVTEVQHGNMLQIQVTDEYEKSRSKFNETIEEFRNKVEKTVDLFSRIKNTNQAEEVLTVLFSSKELRRQYPDRIIKMSELLEFVYAWKPHWKTEERTDALKEAILNLTALRWIRAEIDFNG